MIILLMSRILLSTRLLSSTILQVWVSAREVGVTPQSLVVLLGMMVETVLRSNLKAPMSQVLRTTTRMTIQWTLRIMSSTLPLFSTLHLFRGSAREVAVTPQSLVVPPGMMAATALASSLIAHMPPA